MPTPLEFHRVEEITSKGIFIPPVFVVQIHVPSPNNVMHMKRDGPGVTFVMYFTLSKVRACIFGHSLTSIERLEGIRRYVSCLSCTKIIQ